MKQKTLVLTIILATLPFCLALLIGLFTDYTDPDNRRWMYFHPGYYYYSSRMSTRGGVIYFRGGGPDFGK